MYAEDQADVRSASTLGIVGRGAAGGIGRQADFNANRIGGGLADRLVSLVQQAHAANGTLAAARERLCGPWPEGAAGGGGLACKPSGQIDPLLEELGSTLSSLIDHANAINGRI